MVLVEVIDSPIRYKGVRYYKGELFEIESHFVVPAVMKLVGEVDKDQTDFFIGEPIVLDEQRLKLMSVDGLKDYADEHGIKLGRATTKDGILEKIIKIQNE